MADSKANTEEVIELVDAIDRRNSQAIAIMDLIGAGTAEGHQLRDETLTYASWAARDLLEQNAESTHELQVLACNSIRNAEGSRGVPARDLAGQ